MIIGLRIGPAWWAAEWDRCVSPVQQWINRRGTSHLTHRARRAANESIHFLARASGVEADFKS